MMEDLSQLSAASCQLFPDPWHLPLGATGVYTHSERVSGMEIPDEDEGLRSRRANPWNL
jgi:hypothetical protein